MKKFAMTLTAFCACILSMGAGVPYAVPLSADGSAPGGETGMNLGGAGFIIGFALLIVIVVRGWRIGAKTRKKYAESERKAYSYIPRGERVEYGKTDRVRSRAALEDMDFPSGFGGIHNMEQLEHNRALYRLYCEITDNEEGWDDARR